MRRLRWIFAILFAALLTVCGLIAPSTAQAVESVTTASVPSTIPSSLQTLIDEGTVTDGTVSEVEYDDFFGGSLPPGTLVVINRGTDDGSMRPRVDAITGTRPTVIVAYPESFWPVITGKSGALLPFLAPTYDQSKGILIQNNLKVMRIVSEDDSVTYVVWNGYSQGADALGDTVEAAHAEGVDMSKMIFVIDSDPRGPWGIKQGLQKLPGLPTAMRLIGVTPNGARDPAASGDAHVVQRIVTADPVANWQWRRGRPISSLLVNAAGAIGCHSPAGCYGDDQQYEEPTVYTSADGNTTYVVYQSRHAVTLAADVIAKSLGITLSETRLDAIDAAAEKWYPTSLPTPENTAVAVEAVPTAPPTRRSAPETVTPEVAVEDDAPVLSDEDGTDVAEPVVDNTDTVPAEYDVAPTSEDDASDSPGRSEDGARSEDSEESDSSEPDESSDSSDASDDTPDSTLSSDNTEGGDDESE